MSPHFSEILVDHPDLGKGVTIDIPGLTINQHEIANGFVTLTYSNKKVTIHKLYLYDVKGKFVGDVDYKDLTENFQKYIQGNIKIL
jgi:hypothetical protein